MFHLETVLEATQKTVSIRQLAALRLSDEAAICEASEREDVDLVVVGNVGMSGRKEFLLENVPNRVSHNAHCTVVIVQTHLDGANR